MGLLAYLVQNRTFQGCDPKAPTVRVKQKEVVKYLYHLLESITQQMAEIDKLKLMAADRGEEFVPVAGVLYSQ